MNRKQVISVLLVVLVGGAVYFWAHRGGKADADSSDEDNVATLVAVQVGKLQQATLHRYVSGYGAIQPAPADASAAAATARVAPPVAGVVKRVLVVEGGQVKQGAPLVELEDAGARVAVKNAAENAERQKKLYAENNTSLKSLQDAEAQLATAQAQLSLLHITAPLSGTVTRLNVRPGEAVDLTTVLAEITDLSRLVVSAEIPSDEAADLKTGEPVELLGDRPVATSLDYVSPAVDPANGTITVRAAVPPKAGLRAGTLVALRITTGEHADVLTAPAESVVTNQEGDTVVSIVNKDQAVQVPVKTGFRDDGRVEISGQDLKPGDTVVTVGAYGLPAKTQVQIAQP